MKTPPPVMKRSASRICTGALAAAALFGTAASVNAAFIIEASDTPTYGAGHFSYTGAGGTAASFSNASAGNLPATTDAVPTFFTLRHAYGGNGTADEYTFTYTPSVDTNNINFAAGTLYNSRGVNPDLVSSGLAGGTAGIYNIYQIHPANPGVTAGNSTIYDVLVNGSLAITQTINQNLVDSASGTGVGRWELIGSVSLFNATDTIEVTMTPTPNAAGFVSMRASGIMFEYVAQIPEPGSIALLCLGAMAFCGRHRR